MEYSYVAMIKECGESMLVYVPDFEIYTVGESFSDAIEMAKDAISNQGMEMIKLGLELPEASTITEAINKAKVTADDILDYSDGMTISINVRF